MWFVSFLLLGGEGAAEAAWVAGCLGCSPYRVLRV